MTLLASYFVQLYQKPSLVWCHLNELNHVSGLWGETRTSEEIRRLLTSNVNGSIQECGKIISQTRDSSNKMPARILKIATLCPTTF